MVNDKIVSAPLYMKVYKRLLKSIEDGTFGVDSMLPSEADLQNEFGVSRITVRRALQELEFSGHVIKQHGKGTFVLPRKPYSNLVAATSFSQEAMKAGERPSSVILEFEIIKASLVVSEYLQIEESEKVYYLKRLRLKNGRIIGLNETYISNRIGITIEDELDENTSIYEMYKKAGLVIERATETIEALMPSESVRADLYMKAGEPVFRRERITYGKNNVPLEYSNNLYKANEYKYIIELKHE